MSWFNILQFIFHYYQIQKNILLYVKLLTIYIGDTAYKIYPQHFAKSQKMPCYEELIAAFAKFSEASESDIKFWTSFSFF